MMKGQASFEYMTTYGWAILAAMVAIGALANFGLLSPSNLLPKSCDFGSQLQCVEYQIFEDGQMDIIFRNNFGKPIEITDAQLPGGSGILGAHPFAVPIICSILPLPKR